MSDKKQGTMPPYAVTLLDCMGGETKIPTKVHFDGSGIWIEPEGYSDMDTAEEFSSAIVTLEVCKGKLRLVVWADINKEDPTHVIDLEGAKKSARNPD